MVGLLLKILQALGVQGVFAQIALKKIGIAGTAIAVFIAASGAFIASLNYLIGSIAVQIPTSMTLAISWFVPSNAVACVSAYYAAMAARWLYYQKTKIIQYSIF